MRSGPIQELQAARRRTSTLRNPRLVIAGATGVLGNEVLRRLVGLQWFESTQVLAREPTAPELVWRAAHGELRQIAGQWLQL
jgi:hypothetical protein